MKQAPSVAQDGLDHSKLRFTDVNGTRTRYYEDGTGEPLVLFHGGQFGSLYALDPWSLNLPGLARHFHVYAVDKLGQGYTDNPAGDDWTFDALLRHSLGLLETLGIRDAHIAGHSRGGLLVAAMAFARPDLVKSVVIVDSSTLAPADPRYPEGVFYEEIDKRTPPGPPTRDTVRMEPDAQAHSLAQVTDDFVSRLLAIAQTPRHAEANARMATLAQMKWFPSMAEHKAETLRRIDESGLPRPTLMSWGFNDRSAPLPLGHELFRRIAARTPQAEFHVLNGAGHYSFREQYPAWNRLVRAFCLE
jgi:2-hydroxy-6-oxonona-2,4-dienedioate hydrolase